jgi:hypothetical protein
MDAKPHATQARAKTPARSSEGAAAVSNRIDRSSRAAPQRQVIADAPHLFPHCTQHVQQAQQIRQTHYTQENFYTALIRFY